MSVARVAIRTMRMLTRRTTWPFWGWREFMVSVRYQSQCVVQQSKVLANHSFSLMIRLVPTVGYDRLIGKRKCRSLYDPLMDDEPALAYTLAASVKQRMAFGERVGQQVRRMSSGFGSVHGERCRSAGRAGGAAARGGRWRGAGAAPVGGAREGPVQKCRVNFLSATCWPWYLRREPRRDVSA